MCELVRALAHIGLKNMEKNRISHSVVAVDAVVIGHCMLKSGSRPLLCLFLPDKSQNHLCYASEGFTQKNESILQNRAH